MSRLGVLSPNGISGSEAPSVAVEKIPLPELWYAELLIVGTFNEAFLLREGEIKRYRESACVFVWCIYLGGVVAVPAFFFFLSFVSFFSCSRNDGIQQECL